MMIKLYMFIHDIYGLGTTRPIPVTTYALQG